MNTRNTAFAPNVAGEMYEPIRTNISNEILINAVERVMNSDKFELGERSHVFLKGTETRVGYIGTSALELYLPESQNFSLYRIPHKHLRRIFRAS